MLILQFLRFSRILIQNKIIYIKVANPLNIEVILREYAFSLCKSLKRSSTYLHIFNCNFPNGIFISHRALRTVRRAK